jgi:hypothetical protein
MVMNMTSQSGDTCAPHFWSYGPGNNQYRPPLPPALPLCWLKLFFGNTFNL